MSTRPFVGSRSPSSCVLSGPRGGGSRSVQRVDRVTTARIDRQRWPVGQTKCPRGDTLHTHTSLVWGLTMSATIDPVGRLGRLLCASVQRRWRSIHAALSGGACSGEVAGWANQCGGSEDGSGRALPARAAGGSALNGRPRGRRGHRPSPAPHERWRGARRTRWRGPGPTVWAVRARGPEVARRQRPRLRRERRGSPARTCGRVGSPRPGHGAAEAVLHDRADSSADTGL